MPRNRSLFSCKQPPQIDIRGWVASHVGLWQKAILHHLICSSHANKSEAEWNKKESTSPPPHYTAHTRSLFAYGKRITTTPLCLLVSLMGEAGEHHSPPGLGSVQVLVNAFEWVFVLLPTPNLLTPIPTGPKGFHLSCFIQAYRFCGEVSSVVVSFGGAFGLNCEFHESCQVIHSVNRLFV